MSCVIFAGMRMRTAHFTLAAAINMTRITSPDAFLVVYQQNGLACPARQLLDRRARLADYVECVTNLGCGFGAAVPRRA
jgi:hypothetical protein